jgi:hypothetical protein
VSDTLVFGAAAVNELEMAWYNRILKHHYPETLVEAVAHTCYAVAASAGSATEAKGPYAGFPQHPCAGKAGRVESPEGRVFTGLSINPRQNQNTVLCIDLNGKDTPNQPGDDIYFANFNPTGDFDTRPTDHTFEANPHGRNFFWGDEAHGLFTETGKPLPGITFDKGTLAAILNRH